MPRKSTAKGPRPTYIEPWLYPLVMDIKDLVHDPENVREHDADNLEAIMQSLQGFGQQKPIVINEEGRVIAGNGTLSAALELGWEYIAVVKSRLTGNNATAYAIADNRTTDLSVFDEKRLAKQLKRLQEDVDIDHLLTGFSDDDITELVAQALDVDGVGNDGLTDPDEIPIVPKKPITKPGDIWVLGKHRVMCADSKDITAVQKMMAGKQADMLLTDPPYNVAYTGKTADALTIQNDEMSDDDFRQFLRDVYTTADAVMRQGAVFYIWHADSEGYNFRGAAHDIGWQIRQCLIWNKNSLVMGRQDYHWKHEPCLYGWKGGAGHHWGSDRSQTTVLDFDRPTRSEDHPTMKPVALFEYQIQNSCPVGGIVLDLFCGSGTTVIACEQSGRIARTVELDPRYCDVIVRRWEEFTGKKAKILKG